MVPKTDACIARSWPQSRKAVQLEPVQVKRRWSADVGGSIYYTLQAPEGWQNLRIVWQKPLLTPLLCLTELLGTTHTLIQTLSRSGNQKQPLLVMKLALVVIAAAPTAAEAMV